MMKLLAPSWVPTFLIRIFGFDGIRKPRMQERTEAGTRGSRSRLDKLLGFAAEDFDVEFVVIEGCSI
jgi:hypothetical protein